MPQPHIQPIADALATILRAQGLTVPDGAWARGELDPPAAEIELPDGDRGRTEPDGGETELGSRDLFLEFTVTLWHDLTEPTAASQRAIAALEGFIDAVDSDPTLGVIGVQDSKVVGFEVVYGLGQPRPLIGFETRVRVWRLI